MEDVDCWEHGEERENRARHRGLWENRRRDWGILRCPVHYWMCWATRKREWSLLFCWPQRNRKQRCAHCVIITTLKMSLIEKRGSTLKHSSGEWSRLPAVRADRDSGVLAVWRKVVRPCLSLCWPLCAYHSGRIFYGSGSNCFPSSWVLWANGVWAWLAVFCMT